MSYNYINGTICYSWLNRVFKSLLDKDISSNSTYNPEYESDQEKSEDKIEKQPVLLLLKEINRNGLLTIDFNQPLVLPAFVDRLNGDDERRLAAETNPIDDLNSTIVDALDLQIQIYSDDEGATQFEYSLIQWTEERLQIKLEFTHPLSISRGFYKDDFIVEVKDPRFFMSKNYPGEVLENNYRMMHELSRQLPPDVSEEDLRSSAKTTQRTINSIMLIQIIV